MATRALTAADMTRIVHTIRVTIHTTGKFFESDTRSGNHASIYLLTSDGSTSIRLNMTKAGPVDTMGTYQLSHCNYRDTNSALQNFDLKAAPNLTVQHVLALIETKGRHKYKLARSGVGCRFWVQTVINDLNTSAYISFFGTAAREAVEGLRYNYSRSKAPVFEDVDPGKFV